MKVRRVMMGVAGSLVLSGAALAQGGMGMGMMGGGDGKVSKEEFMKNAEERFAQMDANKDGVIDAADRKQMRQRMNECRELMGGMQMMGGGMGMMGGTGMMGDPGTTEKDGKDDASHHPKP